MATNAVIPAASPSGVNTGKKSKTTAGVAAVTTAKTTVNSYDGLSHCESYSAAEIGSMSKFFSESLDKDYVGRALSAHDPEGNPLPKLAYSLLKIAFQECEISKDGVGLQTAYDLFTGITRNPRLTKITLNSKEFELKSYAECWKSLPNEVKNNLAGYLGSCNSKYYFASSLAFRVEKMGKYIGTIDPNSDYVPRFPLGSAAMIISRVCKIMTFPRMIGQRIKQRQMRVKQILKNKNKDKDVKDNLKEIRDMISNLQSGGKKSKTSSNQKGKNKGKGKEKARNEESQPKPKKKRSRKLDSFRKQLNKIRRSLVTMKTSDNKILDEIVQNLLKMVQNIKNDELFNCFKKVVYEMQNAIYQLGIILMSKSESKPISGLTPELVYYNEIYKCQEAWLRHYWYVYGEWRKMRPPLLDPKMILKEHDVQELGFFVDPYTRPKGLLKIRKQKVTELNVEKITSMTIKHFNAEALMMKTTKKSDKSSDDTQKKTRVYTNEVNNFNNALKALGERLVVDKEELIQALKALNLEIKVDEDAESTDGSDMDDVQEAHDMPDQ